MNDLPEPRAETGCERCHGAGVCLGADDRRVQVLCGCVDGLEVAAARAEYFPRLPLISPGYRWEPAEHELTCLRAAGRVALVDAGIASEVRKLWEAGIWTLASCEGGGYRGCLAPVVSIADPARAEDARLLLPWVAAVEVREECALLTGAPV
jgi:hypothetical protein